MENKKYPHLQEYFNLQNRFPMWVVYRPTTKDFPGKWIARMHLTLPEPEATDWIIAGDTLEEVRAQLPPFLITMDRFLEDDPVIEEVWM